LIKSFFCCFNHEVFFYYNHVVVDDVNVVVVVFTFAVNCFCSRTMSGCSTWTRFRSRLLISLARVNVWTDASRLPRGHPKMTSFIINDFDIWIFLEWFHRIFENFLFHSHHAFWQLRNVRIIYFHHILVPFAP